MVQPVACGRGRRGPRLCRSVLTRSTALARPEHCQSQQPARLPADWRLPPCLVSTSMLHLKDVCGDSKVVCSTGGGASTAFCLCSRFDQPATTATLTQPVQHQKTTIGSCFGQTGGERKCRASAFAWHKTFRLSLSTIIQFLSDFC